LYAAIKPTAGGEGKDFPTELDVKRIGATESQYIVF
jgi:hypothetical protein